MSSDAERVEDANGQPQQELAQIREILFGTQSRDIDSRFQHAQDQLSEAIGGLRSLITERSDSLSRRLEEEVQRLQQELNQSRQVQQETKQELDNRLTNTANDLRQQVGALSETLSAAERSMRNDLDKGLAELREHLTSQMEAAREQLTHDLGQVSRASVTRRSFSEALQELSSRFDDEK